MFACCFFSNGDAEWVWKRQADIRRVPPYPRMSNPLLRLTCTETLNMSLVIEVADTTSTVACRPSLSMLGEEFIHFGLSPAEAGSAVIARLKKLLRDITGVREKHRHAVSCKRPRVWSIDISSSI